MQEDSLGFWARCCYNRKLDLYCSFYVLTIYVIGLRLQVNLFVFRELFLHTLTRVRYFSLQILATVFFSGTQLDTMQSPIFRQLLDRLYRERQRSIARAVGEHVKIGKMPT